MESAGPNNWNVVAVGVVAGQVGWLWAVQAKGNVWPVPLRKRVAVPVESARERAVRAVAGGAGQHAWGKGCAVPDRKILKVVDTAERKLRSARPVAVGQGLARAMTPVSAPTGTPSFPTEESVDCAGWSPSNESV